MKRFHKHRWLSWASCLCLAFLLSACGSEFDSGLSSGTENSDTTHSSTAVTSGEEVLARGVQSGPRPGPQPDPSGTPTGEHEYRTLDGVGNNQSNPQWGSAGTTLRRAVLPAYADGISEPSGADRPSPREISNAVVAQSQEMEDPEGRTAYVWAWGQFLDHDIDLTPEGDEEFPIAIPAGDIYFDPFGTGEETIPFSRSIFDEATGDSTDNPRLQTNVITAFIDGSQVYGSDEERAAALRSFEGGKLKTSDGDLPPFNQEGLDNAATGAPGDFFLCGDIRANENVVLTSLHTLFLREHNRFAEQTAAAFPDLDDEELYQRARKHVGALIQVITYNEFLPAILGRPLPEYRGYRPQLDPGVSVLFSTAAYRLGHSQVGSTLLRLGPDGQPIEEGNLTIADAFFNPSLLVDEGGIDPILRGLVSTLQQPTDSTIVDDLRNFLFGPPGSGGLDLASLNLQRGRDHGLDSYNAIRQHYGRPAAASFADITSDTALQAKLASVYDSVDQVDPWVGLLSEDHVRGAAVGPTLQAALTEQFLRLRDGDRFFYRHDPQLRQRLEQLDRTRLADVIERNTGLTDLPDNVFRSGRVRRDPRPPRRRPPQPLPPFRM